jgi:hypothetical protein
MKKVALVLGIAAGLFVLLIIGVWLFLDVNRYHATIQGQLEQQLGRKVTLGKMSLGLLPPRFQVADAVIADDPRFNPQAPFLRAENLSVQVGLLSLVRGNIKVRSLELRRPSVELVKDRNGTWNFSTLGASGGPSAVPAPTTPSQGGTSRGLELDKLAITDGQVAITDQQKRSRSVYDHIDLTVANYAPAQPFSFDLAAHIQGEGQQEVRIKGEAGPVNEAQPAETPFRGNLSLNQVGIDGLKKFLDSDALAKMSGSLTGDGQFEGKSGNMTGAGKLKLEKARFNDVDIGYPIELDYNLGANVPQSILTIKSATVRLGKTPLSLTGSVNAGTDPPTLDVRMNTKDVSISEIARLASAFGVAFAPGTTVNGQVGLDLQARGDATKPALNGNVAARNIQISGQSVPQPVEIKAIDLALSPTEIRSNEFNATSGKTTVSVRFALRQYTSNSPSIDAGLRAPNATLPEIQSLAKAYGLTGLDQINGAGTLNLDMQAAGPVNSLNSTSMMRALNGAMNLDFSPLRINGFDALSELAVIGGFASPENKKNFTDISKLTGRILVKNGIAQTSDLAAQLGIGNIAAAGTADLATEMLNMKVNSVFSKEFSDKVGSTRVAGYLRTALSNEAGELVVPAIVTGNFKQPKFAPDAQAFAQMQKQRFLPSLKNPAAALDALRGLTSGSKQQPSQDQSQQQGQQPQKSEKPTVKGVLEGLFGNKK